MTDAQDRMSTEEAVDAIWKLAEKIEFCMFVTWDGDRQRARPLAARVDRDAHRIYFLTDTGGAKDDQVRRFPKVSLTFADTRSHDYLAITGTASVSDDRDTIRRIWSSADKAFWESPDEPSIRLITFEPEDGEVWKGPSRAIAAAKLISAAVTGGGPDLGENRKVGHL